MSIGKKLNRLRYRLPPLGYPRLCRKLPVDPRAVLLESQHGTGMDGNIYYLLRVLAGEERYRDMTLYLTCRPENRARFRARLDAEGMERVQLLELHSKAYIRALATCRYLIGDITFYPLFVKRPEQIYLNTWHGTPLKTLGRRVKGEPHNIAGPQKNFLMADYLLYPNEYTAQHMIEDYMLAGLLGARVLLGGYPRNTVFFDTADAARQRERYRIADKRVYAFLPTWRGRVGAADPEAGAALSAQLSALDAGLTAEEVLFVKLHPMAKKDVALDRFSHIRPFPDDCETYRFLNAADVLITDYSSVFYDFAITRKKCVLFTPDAAAYEAERGFYRPLSSLPFPQTADVPALLAELRKPKAYDDTAFLAEYCPFDRPDAASLLCARVIGGEVQEGITERACPPDDRETVLVYAGDLARNGITTSLLDRLALADREKYHFVLTFRVKAAAPNAEVLHRLPDGVTYIATEGREGLGVGKTLAQKLFVRYLLPFALYRRLMRPVYDWERRRCFGDAAFQTVMQFSGYETEPTLLFASFPVRRVIFVHNDMQQEIRMRRNQRRAVLRYAYGTYDRVAAVTEDLLPSVQSFLPAPRRIDVARNPVPVGRIRARGSAVPAFSPQTRSTHTPEQIAALCADGHCIVNVGRFSPEKGQKRLIDAFARAWETQRDSALLLIGGNQREGLFNRLCAYVQTLPCADRIALVLSLDNPLPFVKRCSGLILSSFYEGFGLVLTEADVLGLPVVSADIVGPRGFMQRYGGCLVPSTDEGIEEGVQRLLSGGIPPLGADYDEYNRQAEAEFAALLTE